MRRGAVSPTVRAVLRTVVGPRMRVMLSGTAGAAEIAGVIALAVVVWRLALGWDWSSVATADPTRTTAPQSGFDWFVFALVIMIGTAWLGARGRAVAGTVGICLPVVVLSGWRLAASGALDWPIGLASLIFALTVASIVAAAVGAWVRHAAAARQVDMSPVIHAPAGPRP